MTDFNVVRQYNFPTTIRFGAGVIRELADHLASVGLSRPLLVTDPVVARLGFFHEIKKSLEARGISVEVFSDIHKNPVKSDVEKGGAAFVSGERDSIIGIGGGAAMDVARAIVLRIHHHRDLFDYDDLIGGDVYVTEEVPYFITVPTTSWYGQRGRAERYYFRGRYAQEANIIFAEAAGEDRICRSLTDDGPAGVCNCGYGDGCVDA